MLKAFVSIVFWLMAFNVNASVIYYYTGNNFDSFTGGMYDSSMSVSGYIELDDFLAPNLVNQNINPLSYSFTDGVSTLTNNDIVPGGSQDTFQFYTNVTGSITMWDVRVSLRPVAPSELGDTSHYIKTRKEDTPFTHEIIDSGIFGTCITLQAPQECAVFNTSGGEIINEPGRWVISAVPVPAAVWLFGSGLLGLIGVARRKKA